MTRAALRPKKAPPMTSREKYGLVLRPLPLDQMDRFRNQVAARPQFTQPTYLVALLDLADELRDAAAKSGNVDAVALLERLGLERVER